MKQVAGDEWPTLSPRQPARDWHRNKVARCERPLAGARLHYLPLLAPKGVSLNAPGHRSPWPDGRGPPPALENRITLDVASKGYGDAELTHLIAGQARGWHAIETLDLGNNRLGAAGMQLLALRQPRTLTTLLLNGNALGSDGMAALLRFPALHLVRLDLADCALGDHGLALLCQSFPVALRELRLGNNALGAASAAPLARAAAARLTLLDISHNFFGVQGLEALFADPWPLLRSLDMGYTFAGRAQRGMGRARKAPVLAALPQLTRLDIGGNACSPQDLARLAERYGQQLRALAICDARLTGDHVRALLHGRWPALLSLNLDQNPAFYGVFAAVLAARQAERLPELRQLLPHPNDPHRPWRGARRALQQLFGEGRFLLQRAALRTALRPLLTEAGPRPPLSRASSSQVSVSFATRVETI